MGDILQNWLHSQLGIKINFDPIYLSKTFQDGVLFKQILNNYGIISSLHIMPIYHSTDFKICQQNLRQLCIWFNLLNINFNENTITDIANGQCSSILRLLYEMYICFENKQHLYYLTNIQRDLKQPISSFGSEDIIDGMPSKVQKVCLKRPLVENKDIIDWYKEKYRLLKEKLKFSHSKHFCDTESTNVTLNQEIKTQNKFQMNDINLVSTLATDDDLSIDDEMRIKQQIFTPVKPKDQYLSMLKLKKGKNSVNKCLTKKMQNTLLDSVWHKIHNAHEKDFNQNFSKLLTKQSQYEKQIVMKLLQGHQDNTLKTALRSLVQREEENLCNLQLLNEFERGKIMYEDEKKRILELHNRLYQEKQRIKAEEHYKLCNEVVDSIINMSFTVSKYMKINNAPVPETEWNDWKQLFFKGLEIPAVCEEYNTIEDDVDSIISLIQDYDDILNEYSLHEYLYLVGSWFVEEECPTLESFDENEQIVLGYVVHRLLELKYPFPPPPKPAEIPPVSVAVMIQGLQDNAAVNTLKMLLSKSQVILLEADDLIKLSIDTFRNETKEPEIDKTTKSDKKKKDVRSKSKLDSKKGSSKKLKEGQAKKEKGKSKKESIHKPSISVKPEEKYASDNLVNLEIILENEKRTQTPAVLPEEDDSPKRTEFGLIGENFFNILNSGFPISDSLLVSALVEYLKQQSVNGWVLINFPTSIVQASFLELILTGKEIPNVKTDKCECNQNEVHRTKQEENLNELRLSKLLPYPHEMHKIESFKSFFNRIIFTKIKSTENKTLPESHSDKTIFTVEEEPDLTVESFYKTQDEFYEFYYDELNINTLKQLARCILSENETERKPSDELFGEEILTSLTRPKKKGRKSEKSKQSSKKPSKKSLKRKKESENIGRPEMSEITCLDEQKESDEVEQLEDSKKEEIKEAIKPGDVSWNYAQFDIPIGIDTALASFWENIETSYLQNLKQQFYNKRILFSLLVPYKNFVSKTIKTVMDQPDNKQNLITEFQEFHNSIDENLLPFTEMKNELHCKIFELQNKLWCCCDKRKVRTANKLKEIINDHWTTNEMCFLTNIYLSLIQIEMDRFISTLNLLNDYYTFMLGKLPTEHKVNFKVSTLVLNSLNGNYQIDMDSMLEEISEITQNKSIHDYILNLLLNDINNQNVNPFCVILEENINKTLENITNIFNNFQELLRKEELAAMLPKQKPKNELKTKNNTKLKKKQKESISEKLVIIPSNAIDETELLKRNLFDEWKYVSEKEMKRAKYRCDLIKCRGVKDLTFFLNEIRPRFYDLFNNIKERYYLDIEMVDNICKIFCTAVEEESKILQKLLISDDKLVVTKQESVVEILWPKELLEQKQKYIFTTEQVTLLMKDLKTASPCGIINKISLVYILEDILLRNRDENVKRLPEMWNDMKSTELKEFVDKIFGDVLLVDWRDLIVFCLNIPFPSIEDLLEGQKQCEDRDPDENETLDFENFTNIVFWFEKELAASPQERLKIVNSKNVLYNLFKDESNKVNYTALFLSFCKDEEPEVGFGKALALAVHKRIILCESDLYLEKLPQSQDDEKYRIVKNVLSGIVNMVLISTECPIITEFEEEVEDVLNTTGEEVPSLHSIKSKTSKSQISKSEFQETKLSNSIIWKSQESIKNFRKESHDTTKQSIKSHSSEQTSTSNKLPTVTQRELCCVSLGTVYEGPWLYISQVPVETIISVIAASTIPGNNTLNIQETLDQLIDLAVDSHIPVHLLLDLPCMTDLFLNSQKFNLHSVHDITLKIIQEKSIDKKS